MSKFQENTNMSRLLKLAQKFNCFYLSGKYNCSALLNIARVSDFHLWNFENIDRYKELCQY